MTYINNAINFDKIIDVVEKDIGTQCISLERGAYIKNAIYSGSLTLDLIVGGGWPPGRWLTLSGKEGSGKSTISYYSLKHAIKSDVPAFFFDHEGSTEEAYLERILGMSLEDIQGLRNEKGKWIRKPKIRYYSSDIGEETFRFMHRILKNLPDKKKEPNKHTDQWYLVYKNTTTNKNMIKKKEEILQKEGILQKDESIYDKRLFQKTKKYWIPCKDGSLQVLFFIDSLPSMLPESRNENDEASPMAKQARMFSDNMPLVKPLLRQKRATVVATNQLREKPMAYGDPFYEPGGNAPLHNSDGRIRLSTCANPKSGKTGQIEEEASFDGEGIDKYRYIKLKTIKNKMFSPFRESYLRIWFEESGRPGRGIDPVWDCYQFLKETGQIEKSKNSYILQIPGIWNDKKITWPDFKQLILDPKLNLLEFYKVYKLKDDKIEELRKQRKRVKKENKSVSKLDLKLINLLKDTLSIRKTCRNQLEDSTAFKLYFDNIGGKKEEDVDNKSFTIED